nr:uncharacterized protein LOC117279573 [Nicotiana tomentosiformis]
MIFSKAATCYSRYGLQNTSSRGGLQLPTPDMGYRTLLPEVTPHGHEEWREMLTHLSREFIKWKISWLSGRAILRSPGKYFIELVGLERIQSYAPLRVLRQFDLIQDVPLLSRIALYEDDYNGQILIPRVRRLQDECNDFITMGMGQNPWCTSEYFVWIDEEDKLAKLSREGLTGLEDSAISLKIYHEILPYYLLTTAMHQQVVPRSVDHMLPPPDDDDQVIEYIQIELEIDLEEDHNEELEYNNDEDEEDVEDYPKE